jgi:NAD(P)-dependent dehydrogenase (short-subunit alcohol dehydrogenase family)
MLDSFGLDGRTAVVTGASRGLGRGMAQALGRAGARVVLVGRDGEELNRVAAELAAASCEALVRPLDLFDVGGIESWVNAVWSEVGQVEIVLHSAGHQRRAPAIEVEPADWDQILTVNLTAPFFLSREFGKRQAAVESGGSHIFIGSLTTRIGIANAAAYAASKAGLAGVVRTLAVEWASSNIRVNAIAPGYFRTELTEGNFQDPERSAWVHSRIPMGRLGMPEDLGGAAVFLASDASSYVTGAILDVDGGWLAS